MPAPKKILMVISQSNFRDEEYLEPKEIFQKAHFEVQTVGERKGEALGKFGAKVWVDFPFAEINVHNFDAVVFVGGPGAADYLNNPEVLNLARDFFQEGKLVAAICIAPGILANAGLLAGKKATVCYGEEENLKNRGAIYTGSMVEKDGKIITANGPEAAVAFANTIVEALG